MKLSELQRKFTIKTSLLIDWAYKNGYELTYGETYRPPETAELYAKQGRGSIHSNHCLRLAVDFNLFINDEYIQDTSKYLPLGQYWESLSSGEIKCRWGGNFRKLDGNHFSIEYQGRA